MDEVQPKGKGQRHRAVQGRLEPEESERSLYDQVVDLPVSTGLHPHIKILRPVFGRESSRLQAHRHSCLTWIFCGVKLNMRDSKVSVVKACKSPLLNRCSELVSTCRHRRKHLLLCKKVTRRRAAHFSRLRLCLFLFCDF